MVDPLDPVDRLPGLGPAAKRALAEHGVRAVVDLLWTPPTGWDDLRAPRSLREVVESAREAPVRATFAAVVDSASMVPIGRRRGVRVVLRDVEDAKCKVHAFWFFAAHGILGAAKPGAAFLATAKVTTVPGKPPRTAHPDLVPDTPEARSVRARYPRLGPSGALLRRAIAHAAAELTVGQGSAVDPVPPRLATRERMPDAARILRSVHAADGDVPTEEDRRRFVERLAWAEAFARTWERLLAEESLGTDPATTLPAAPKALGRLEAALGFALTDEQRRACAEIAADLASPRPMRRLLLGDVGTGKTAVALAAAAQCVLAKRQVAILAPTSVLAEQYLAAARPLVEATGARVAFLVADLPLAARREAAEAIAGGAADVAIGTHALLGEGVVFPRLSLVIVDEQQRLGVGQRLALVKKGQRPHLLTLSATPIPRTLALALRGELATSILRERPAGRGPVATSLVALDDQRDVLARARAAIGRGERVFWVVPRIEATADDEDDDEAGTVEARAKALGRSLGKAAIGAIHGRRSGAEKRAAMQAFRSGAAPVLVGTTVVEVGVDVPEATLIVIEEAERYGLAQLHQLRGRVGRGAREGSCVLLHGPIEGAARRRLEALVALDRGEDVARADLELRGAGDLGGTRQHGDEDELVYLDPSATYPWLERLDGDVRAVRAADPALERPEHRVLGAFVARFRRAVAAREEAG